MIYLRSIVFIVLLVAAPISNACRCKQLTLNEYYQAADTVVMAQLLASNDLEDHRILEFKLPGSVYKGELARHQSDRVRVATALSSASCGVEVVDNGLYILFASRRESGDDLQWVDSCSGTRVFHSDQLSEPASFVDVPAQFVAQQLNALAGLDVLREVSKNAPAEDSLVNESLTGLLDIKAFSHGGTLKVFQEPICSSKKLSTIGEYANVQTLEVGYEQASAVVYAKLPGWYRIKLVSGKFGWIQNQDTGTYFSYSELPIRRLAYVKKGWSGYLWPDAGAGLPSRYSLSSAKNAEEIPVNVLKSEIVGGMPWFQIEVLDTVCEGKEDKILMTGWVPGYGRSGEHNVWFHSRGC